MQLSDKHCRQNRYYSCCSHFRTACGVYIKYFLNSLRSFWSHFRTACGVYIKYFPDSLR